MKKYLILLVIVLSAFIFTSNTKKDDQGNEKVLVCHIPPGNPDNAHTISVSENAVQAHLDHGDYVGECQKEEIPY